MKKATILMMNYEEPVVKVLLDRFYLDEEKIKLLDRIKEVFDEVEETIYSLYMVKKFSKVANEFRSAENFVRWLMDYLYNVLFKEECFRIEERVYDGNEIRRWEIDIWQKSSEID